MKNSLKGMTFCLSSEISFERMKNQSIESASWEPVELVLRRRIDAGKQCLWMQNSSTARAHNLNVVCNECMQLSTAENMH